MTKIERLKIRLRKLASRRRAVRLTAAEVARRNSVFHVNGAPVVVVFMRPTELWELMRGRER
jgi:hypothetical protein